MSALPPGPRDPPLVQALNYVWRFPAFSAAQHARHGATFTLRLPGLPASVLTTDRELIRHVLTGDPLTRRHANDILEPLVGRWSVMLLEPAQHLARRRLLLPPFHGERVRGYARLMRELVEADLDRWPTDEPVRVHERARMLTLNVIEAAVLGVRDDAFTAELAELLDAMATPLSSLGMFAPALQRRSRWNLPAERFHRLLDRMQELLERWVRTTRADPRLEERDDVLALLARATDDDGNGLTDAELTDELKTLLIAGHETTATAIAWAADLLAHDRPAAERLYDAVREGDGGHVSNAAKEVLRLRTIIPVALGRTLLEDTEHDGEVLPAGTVLLADAFNLHRDPQLHPAPQAFRPERFANGGPPPYSYLPFGGGAHRCLGASLASLELEVALTAILERFELAPAGPPERPSRRGPTFVPARGARVNVRPRRSS